MLGLLMAAAASVAVSSAAGAVPQQTPAVVDGILVQAQPRTKPGTPDFSTLARRPAAVVITPERRIQCGMIVIEADPSIDPHILIKPSNSDVKHAIRTIDLPPCATARTDERRPPQR